MLLATLLGVFASFLIAELGMRFLLFSSSDLANSLGAKLRNPAWFADGDGDDDYWKLRWKMAGLARPGRIEVVDPVLGWSSDVDPKTYLHPAMDQLRGRTPVLLYGDSFAMCNTPPSLCFQAILERSDLSSSYRMLNFGVGGYGLDQEYLMIKGSLDHFAKLDPIVVVGLLVDSDFDRCALSFRDWPKPRLTVRDDRLELEEPVTTDIEAYLDRHPISITSYLLRFLAFGPAQLPSAWKEALAGDHQKRAYKTDLCRRILCAIHDEIQQRGMRCFFLIFQGEAALQGAPEQSWQEPIVREVCRERGIPLISTRPFLLAAGNGDVQEARQRLFGGSEQLRAHYNRAGNLVVFEAMRQGILGHFEEPSDTSLVTQLMATGELEPTEVKERSLRLLGLNAQLRWLSVGSCICFGTGKCPPLATDDGMQHLALRGGESAPTELTFTLDQKFARFHATVMRPDAHAERCPRGRILLAVEVDGVVQRYEEISRDPQGIALDLSLTGARRLTLRVTSEVLEPDCGWIYLADPRFE